MKYKFIPLLWLIILLLITGCHGNDGVKTENKGKGKCYYVSDSGDDYNPGSITKPWKTLEKINQIDLKPGDNILLEGGVVFKGTMHLDSLDSGKEEKIIIIGSYGIGRAIIDGANAEGIVVKNCSHFIIRDLIVKGSGRKDGNVTDGVYVTGSKYFDLDSLELSGFQHSGLHVHVCSEVKVTNVYAHDNGFAGIHVTGTTMNDPVNYDNENIYIGYCIAENNPGCPAIKDNHSGNGILISGVTKGLIEYCGAMNNGWDMPREGNGPVGIWAYMSDSITIQYCYAHHNKTSARGKDGGGFDFDGGMKYSVMQYNLSAFNEGAGYGIFQYAGATEWADNIVRYNISYNDGSKNGQCGILVWCDLAAVPMNNFHAYNNTIVNNYAYGINFEPGDYKGFRFENNIIQVTVATEKFIGGNFTQAAFDKNLYWCDFKAAKGMPQPTIALDKNALYYNPKLNLPTDTFLLKNTHYTPDLKYFYLQEESACINTGKKIADNGGYDYWKNRVLSEINPNIGAWQGK